MRTTIEIPDPLFKRAKKAATDRGVSLREVVLAALRAHLDLAPSTGAFVFDWRPVPGPWADLPVDNNAALNDILDPIERYLPPEPGHE